MKSQVLLQGVAHGKGPKVVATKRRSEEVEVTVQSMMSFKVLKLITVLC